MRPVLLAVDVQNELVEDPRLQPPGDVLVPRIAQLLRICRDRDLPILHAAYITEPDGRGFKAHHAATGASCARGTRGAAPPDPVQPRAGEPVFAVHTYSAFSSPELDARVAELDPDPLIVCGLYTHACVRQTVLDALERGRTVWVVDDAVASYDPLHAEVTRAWLMAREVRFLDILDLEELLGRAAAPPPAPGAARTGAAAYPVACIAGRWIARGTERALEHRDPSRWEDLIGLIPMAGRDAVDAAVAAAVVAQRSWGARPLDQRLDAVRRWMVILADRAEAFAQLAAREVAKPIREARLEIAGLLKGLHVACECIAAEPAEVSYGRAAGQEASARRRPLGVVAIIGPWNNPTFLPACKIAAAIALGNGVVWKPALPCPGTSVAVQDSLLEAGVPAGLVNLVFGGAETAQRLVSLPGVAAVTLTGSVRTGKHVGAVCGSLLKPLQAELGGNNAALVTAACDRRRAAEEIARNAFVYAGQSCTATRRLVVPAELEEEMVELVLEAARAMRIADPQDDAADVGPLISRTQQRRVEALAAAARAAGARVREVALPDGLAERGCWAPPRIVQGLPARHPLVQEESFGPILVVQPAADLDDAIRLCNGVAHGLVGAIYSDDPDVRRRFLDAIETGVVKLDLPTRGIRFEAPFGGWKDSGLGVPEHGRWDLDFYTRWQAVYERCA